MDQTKKAGLAKLTLFFYLILFPFGQLLRTSLNFSGMTAVFHPIDVPAFASLVLVILIFGGKLLSKKGYPGVFLISNIFSLILSINYFGLSGILVGVLYFLRLLAHGSLFFLVFYLLKYDSSLRKTLVNILILLSMFVGIFGWFQYYIYPDLTSFTVWGWDDHLYRLVGSFLDPSFTSIFLVLGALLCLIRYFASKKAGYLFLFTFLIVTLGFTYSRAGFLALLFAIFYFLYQLRRLRLLAIVMAVFFICLVFLPRPAGEGVKLERTRSIISRLENYQESFSLWRISPVFGLGYNNLCAARHKFIPDSNFGEHSCSGSDSSILLLLTCFGLIGTLFFGLFLRDLLSQVSKNFYGSQAVASVIAVLVHSQFANSLFYPWLVGWMAILFAVAVKTTSNNVR
jgi:O-antigen ligase